MKVYTKQGDGGTTSLVNGEKVSKSHLRLETYGGTDELNCHLGLLIVLLGQTKLNFTADIAYLTQVQNDLFNLGSQLACPDEELGQKLPGL